MVEASAAQSGRALCPLNPTSFLPERPLERRWVVERSFAWAARFRRLARDDERLPETLAGSHFLVFAILMLTCVMALMGQSA